MSIQEHEAQTKTDRLIAAFERLCDKLDEISAKLDNAEPVRVYSEMKLETKASQPPIIPVAYGKAS